MPQNKYHRYLNLPFEIRKPQICNVKPKDLKHYDISNHKDNNISEFVKQWGLQIVNTELFYTHSFLPKYIFVKSADII